MRLLDCKVENFGSYKSLEFDFSGLGLALVYGRTGAGKSTVLDIVPWVLFGTTAKGGSVEDIRSWQSEGNATTGVLSLECGASWIQVTRIRGKTGQNDLYWVEDEAGSPKRGKDLSETQRLLESRLGLSADLYLTSAYFNEFSQTGAFFTAKARDRREVFEQVADLRTPVKLAQACTEAKKAAKAQEKDARTAFNVAFGRLGQLQMTVRGDTAGRNQWKQEQEALLASLLVKADTFDQDLEKQTAAAVARIDVWEKLKNQQIDTLIEKMEALKPTLRGDDFYATRIAALQKQAKCDACGGLLKNGNDKLMKFKEEQQKNAHNHKTYDASADALETAVSSVNPHLEQLELVRKQVNTYKQQHEAEAAEVNPFEAGLQENTKTLKQVESEVAALNAKLTEITRRHASLELLYSLSFELRGQLLRQAVKDIEAKTNKYLEKYFDSEIKVAFSLDADELEVALQKGGYECSFRQLSKGQRGLLKLSFAVAIMDAAANTGGVHFSAVMLDEALDGLDTQLKLKAFRLLEDLSTTHETVLVVDHAEELQNLFSRKFKVELEADYSTIEDA